jgi:mono/diheme cytochrome c family protein
MSGMRAARRFGILFGACLALAAILAAGSRAANVTELPAGPNRDIVYATCQTCHSLQYLLESAGIDRDQWNSLLDGMGQYGLQVTPANRAKILDYLATYLGPHPPPAAPATAAAPMPGSVDGATLFKTQCIGCHQQSGQGVPSYFPPLAGNRDLFRNRIFPVYVLLNGLTGEIKVEGHTFNGQMPSFAHLTDAEIAALINYVRGAWNNAALRPSDMAPIDAATVKGARAKPMSTAEVHAYRAGLE